MRPRFLVKPNRRGVSHDVASGSGGAGRSQRCGGSADGAVGRRACERSAGDYRGSAAGADPVSLQTAAGFSAQGVEHAVVTAEGVEELGRAGVGVGESGASYLAGDAAAAATYGVVGG